MAIDPDFPLSRTVMTTSELDDAGMTRRNRRTVTSHGCLCSPAKGYCGPTHPHPRCRRQLHIDHLRQFVELPINPRTTPDLRAAILRSLSLARRTRSEAAVSGFGAGALHGLPVIVPTPRSKIARAELTCTDTSPSHHAGDSHFVLPLDGGDTVTVDGIVLTSVLRTVADVAVLHSPLSGLAMADFVLASHQADAGEVREAISRHPRLRRDDPALTVAALASPHAESPGESWCRWALHSAGLPAPCEQVSIWDDRYGFVGRVDFAWPDRGVILEFDGLIKYQGPHGADAVADEKWREDRLRALGWIVIRCGWRDLARFEPVAARIRQELRRGRARLRGAAINASFERLL